MNKCSDSPEKSSPKKLARLKSVACQRFFFDKPSYAISPQDSSSDSEGGVCRLPTFQNLPRQSKILEKQIPAFGSRKFIPNLRERNNNPLELPTSPSNGSTDTDSLIQAFELGFIKKAKRNALNKKLLKIKQGNNTKEAIKDVLEYTMKSRKDQFINELKKMENKIVLKPPQIGRARTKSSIYTSNILNGSPLLMQPEDEKRKGEMIKIPDLLGSDF